MIPHPTDQGKVEPLRTDQFAGLVDAEWRDCIHELIASTPADASPEDWTAWTEIKRSTVRTIFTGEIVGPDGTKVSVHLKLFRAVRLSDRARDAVSGSRSAREFKNLRAALERGLPCVQPLAAGSAAGSCGSRSFLLTRSETGAALPREPLSTQDGPAVGRMLRRAHDAGLHARDLHPGNLLRQPDGNLVLLDLTSATFGDELSEKERGRALAFFCLDLDGNVKDPAARSLLAGYEASPSIVQHAVQAGRRLRNRAVSAAGRRAFRACATTVLEHEPGKPRVSWHQPAAMLWDSARVAFETLESTEPIKSGRRGAVYSFEQVVVKERTAAAARRLFESAYWLAFAGVPTPMPIAVTTFKSRGAAATQRLPSPTLLDEIHAGLSDDTLLTCAKNFGHAVGRLHSLGLRNRDMKFENLIRDPAADTIHMVDLDGIRRQVPGDNRGRASDLGRLLAAFQHADHPGGDAVIGSFLRAYVHICKRLLVPVPHRRYVLTQAAKNARAWATAHA